MASSAIHQRSPVQPRSATASTLDRLVRFPRRTVRITALGWRFVFLSVVVGLAAVNTGNNLLYLLLGMMLSLLTVSGILSERMLRKLAIRRDVPETVYVNQPVMVSLTLISHHPWMPCFSLHLDDHLDDRRHDDPDKPTEETRNSSGARVVYLPPMRAVTRIYRFRARRRGWHRFRGVQVTTRFPFGLFVKSLRLPAEQTQLVYPETKPLPSRLAAHVRTLGYESRGNGRGEGQQLFQLRAYQPGEDARKIHWKVSAKQGRLVLQETQADQRAEITLILPTHPSEGDLSRGDAHGAFEEAVKCAASVASALAETGCRFRAIIGESRGPYGSGPAHFHTIMRTLAVCTLESNPDDGREDVVSHALHDAMGDALIVILPWEHARLRAVCSDRCTMIQARENP